MIDISSKLTCEKPTLKLGEGLVFEIDNSKNTVLKVQNAMKGKEDNEVIDMAIRELLGEEAHKKIESMNLSINAYKNIFIGLMAGISDMTYEEAEKQFRNVKK